MGTQVNFRVFCGVGKHPCMVRRHRLECMYNDAGEHVRVVHPGVSVASADIKDRSWPLPGEQFAEQMVAGE